MTLEEEVESNNRLKDAVERCDDVIGGGVVVHPVARFWGVRGRTEPQLQLLRL